MTATESRTPQNLLEVGVVDIGAFEGREERLGKLTSDVLKWFTVMPGGD